MFKYKIIGDDKKEYGPVGSDVLRAWIQEGRANAQSNVQLDGTTEWRPLITFPELAALLTAVASAPHPFSPIPVYPTPPAKSSGVAVAGFVCGIVGLLCCPFGLLSIVGLVLSIIGLRRANQNPMPGGKGFAIAGIVLSILALIISVIFWICFLAGFMDSFIEK